MAGCAAVAAFAGAAHGQLRPDQVLVIYDSRIADSLAVAEWYAGSAAVPGGAGARPGTRPGVRVMNLANQTATAQTGADVNYTQFINQFRTPIRRFLNDPQSPSDTAHPTRNIITKVRCLVTTRGTPHRVQDLNIPAAGDSPTTAATLVNAGNYTAAALDSELALLWQNLSAGEANGAGDSRADGCVLNPYWRASLPLTAFDNRFITSPKTFTSAIATGVGWTTGGSGSTGLRAGDVYIVARLDAANLAAVQAMTTRATNVYANVSTAAFVIDEGGSVAGLADVAQNTEFDNQGPAETWGGDDYEQTRNTLTSDGRFLSSLARYNGLATGAQFLVGPLQNFGGGIVVSDPLLLLATEGANHVGGTPGSAGTSFPFSFNYAAGCVYNTMESYNGRAFNGLTNGFAQSDASAFLSVGGTFALGNVYEPFTFSVPDNLQIVRNFHLGNLTWGEAALSSLPVLSFQQMILGDPLARVVRSCDDANGDGRLTLDDLSAWTLAPTDINRTGGATIADRRLLETSIRGFEAGEMSGVQR